ncbi:MAG: GAF domain-containing protein, partial [Chloroflexi bacterium]|nr:GAF domain-containing protein [Chloroflexota bacterium]
MDRLQASVTVSENASPSSVVLFLQILHAVLVTSFIIFIITLFVEPVRWWQYLVLNPALPIAASAILFLRWEYVQWAKWLITAVLWLTIVIINFVFVLPTGSVIGSLAVVVVIAFVIVNRQTGLLLGGLTAFVLLLAQFIPPLDLALFMQAPLIIWTDVAIKILQVAGILFLSDCCSQNSYQFELDQQNQWQEATREYALRADAMYVATTALTKSLDLNEVLDTLLAYLENLVPFDAANVMLFQEDGRLAIQAMRGYENYSGAFDKIYEISFEAQVAPTIVAALTSSVLIEDTLKADDWVWFDETRFVRNWIGVPLIVEGKAIGLYSVDKAVPGFFTQKHVQFAEMMAAPAAAAIRNASLYAQVQKYAEEQKSNLVEHATMLNQQYQRQAAVAHLELALNERVKIDEILFQIAKATKTLLPASDASIVLWDEKSDKFYMSATTVPEQKNGSLIVHTIRKQKGATRWVIENQKPFVVADVRKDPTGANKVLTDLGYQAYLGVPLRIGVNRLGVLYAQDKETRDYKQTDIDFMLTLANYVAAAIENYKLLHALQTNKTRLESLLSHAPALLFAFGQDGNITFCKGKALGLFGLKSDDVEGRPFTEILQRFPVLIENCNRALAGDSFQSTLDIFDIIWDVKYTCFEDATTGTPSVLVVATDITPLKKVEREREQYYQQTKKILTRTEALYQVAQSLVAVSDLNTLLRTIVDNITVVLPADRVALYLLDMEKREVVDFVVGGPGGKEEHIASFDALVDGLTGWVLRESKPALSLKKVADSRESTVVQQTRQVHRAGSIIVVPLQYRERKMGTLTAIRQLEESDFVDDDVSLMMAIANQVAAAIETAFLNQQAKRHMLELEERVNERTTALQYANIKLHELDDLRTKFMNDVSHELRTPLTNLKLYLKLLEQGRPEKKARYMDVLNQTSERLNYLVEATLRLSRLEIDKEKLSWQQIDLNQIVEDVRVVHQNRATAKKIALTFTSLPGLPFIWGDKEQLREAVASLVSNGINYTSEGSVELSTFFDKENGQVGLWVADTGTGIAPEDVPHLFDPFYRGNRVGQSTISGMGIGLAIVKEIVTLHQGTIAFENQPEKGTAFTLF